MKPKRKRRTEKEKENLDQIWLRFGLVFSPDSRVMVKAPFSVSLSLFFSYLVFYHRPIGGCRIRMLPLCLSLCSGRESPAKGETGFTRTDLTLSAGATASGTEIKIPPSRLSVDSVVSCARNPTKRHTHTHIHRETVYGESTGITQSIALPIHPSIHFDLYSLFCFSFFSSIFRAVTTEKYMAHYSREEGAPHFSVFCFLVMRAHTHTHRHWLRHGQVTYNVSRARATDQYANREIHTAPAVVESAHRDPGRRRRLRHFFHA